MVTRERNEISLVILENWSVFDLSKYNTVASGHTDFILSPVLTLCKVWFRTELDFSESHSVNVLVDCVTADCVLIQPQNQQWPIAIPFMARSQKERNFIFLLHYM